MIRINKLLRAAKTISKVPVRAGPGWDRPDVPPTQFVETNQRFTHYDIIYTFFDPSMPEFYLTQPQIYEGGFFEALPTFGSVWGVLLGTALSIYVFHEFVNPLRKHNCYEPVQANYFVNAFNNLNEKKVGLKYAKENPIGITINNEQFPYESSGQYYYPKKYFEIKGALEHASLIQSQAANYLKAAKERASQPQHHAPEQSHH